MRLRTEIMSNHQSLHGTDDDVEVQVRSLLARRRATNSSGQSGEDMENIRSAIRATLMAKPNEEATSYALQTQPKPAVET